MKKLIYLLFTALITFSGFAQSQKQITDSSFENSYGRTDTYLNLYLNIDEKGKAEPNVIIKTSNKSKSSISLPFSQVEKLKSFLIEGRKTFYKWDSIRKANEILKMQKEIAVFDEAVRFMGYDYGYFSVMTSIKLNYISWERGGSVMQLRIGGDDGVRNDAMAQYLCDGDKEKPSYAQFDEFLNEFTLENLNKELDKINNKSALFEN